MSAFDDLKGLFRSLCLVARANWNQPDDGDLDDPLGHDEVVAAVAKRNYEAVYPANRHWSSLEPWCNTKSFANFIISILGSLLVVFSTATLAVLASWLITFGGFMLGPAFESSFALWLSGMSMTALLAGSSGVTLGLALRKADKIITMRKCINDAKTALKDRKIYHEERCLLAMQKVDVEVQRQLTGYKKKILELTAEIQSLNDMCDEVESVPHLDPDEVQAGLVPYRSSVGRLTEEVKSLHKQVEKIKEEGDLIKAKIRQSQAMSVMIKTGETLISLVSGRLDEEVRELNESAREKLDRADKDAVDLHDELLIESGIGPLEGGKPRLLK